MKRKVISCSIAAILGIVMIALFVSNVKNQNVNAWELQLGCTGDSQDVCQYEVIVEGQRFTVKSVGIPTAKGHTDKIIVVSDDVIIVDTRD